MPTDASRAQVLIAPETVWGETPPSNAATTRLRITSESLGHRPTTVLSEEIRSDRQRTDLALTGVEAGGDLNMEMIYGAEFEMLLQAALGGTWGTPAVNQLRNGVVNRSFLMEVGWLDITKYKRMTGMVLDRLALEITARRIATITTSWLGKQATMHTSTVAGTTTPTAPAAHPPMKAGSKISILTAGTANRELVGVTARSLSLEIANNLRVRDAVTSEFMLEPGRGVMEITGRLECYFDDHTIFEDFRQNKFFAVAFQVADASRTTANAYKFTLPSLKISEAPVETPGNDADVMIPIQFRALLDAGVGYAIHVDRAIAVA